MVDLNRDYGSTPPPTDHELGQVELARQNVWELEQNQLFESNYNTYGHMCYVNQPSQTKDGYYQPPRDVVVQQANFNATVGAPLKLNEIHPVTRNFAVKFEIRGTSSYLSIYKTNSVYQVSGTEVRGVVTEKVGGQSYSRQDFESYGLPVAVPMSQLILTRSSLEIMTEDKGIPQRQMMVIKDGDKYVVCMGRVESFTKDAKKNYRLSYVEASASSFGQFVEKTMPIDEKSVIYVIKPSASKSHDGVDAVKKRNPFCQI